MKKKLTYLYPVLCTRKALKLQKNLLSAWAYSPAYPPAVNVHLRLLQVSNDNEMICEPKIKNLKN